MPTVALDVFLPQIQLAVAGCSEPVLKNALLKVATDFCTRSLCWHERLTAVTVTDTSFPYTIPVAVHATLTRLLAAHAPGRLWPTTYAGMDAVDNWPTLKGTPTHYLFDASGRLIVYPLPSVATQMTLRAAFTPARGATVVEDFLYTRWRDELVHGAVAELKSMNGQPWTDLANVPYHATRYEAGVSMATTEAKRNLTTACDAVRMRPLA